MEFRRVLSILSMAGVLVIAAVSGLGGAALGQDGEAAPASVTHSEGQLSLDAMLDPGRETISPDGVTQLRGLVATNVVEHTDERLSGTLTWTDIGIDYYAVAVGAKWGHYTIENDGGSWLGWTFGFEEAREAGPVPVYMSMATGAGGHAGLSAICHLTYPGGPGWDGVEECIIFEGPLPDLATPTAE